MSETAKEKMLQVIPFLRDAMKQAREEGEPMLGILAVNPSGGGKVVCRFRADEFVDDLCEVLGVPKENTEGEQLKVAAEKIVQMVKSSGGTIVSTRVDGGSED